MPLKRFFGLHLSMSRAREREQVVKGVGITLG
jgi:hypothetical protein